MRYHDKARRAIAWLFQSYNDIDIYVEDTAGHNLWDILVGRMLEGRAKVKKVFQLGGKDKVLKACAEDQDTSSRRRLYIIDGDYDIALNAPMPDLQHLYRLEVYNVESLLFTENAAVEVAVEQLANSPRATVVATVDFAGLAAAIVPLLSELFASYAAAHATDKTCQTVGYKVERLCVDSGGDVLPTEAKISARVEEVRRAMQGAGVGEQYEARLVAVQSIMQGTLSHKARFVCGKTHLMPLLMHRLRRRATFAGSAEELKVRLARHTSLDVDPGLTRAVRMAAG